MNRGEMWNRIRSHPQAWDMIVVGGGATGVGVAIDAASRGYDVLLLEQSDFGKGSSSRSTKLAHGGVRYLGQGNIGLVLDALKERGLLLENAPHIVHELAFVVPNYDWWEAAFYGLGLKLYQLLAGKYGLGASRILSREETLEHLPTLKTEALRGGAVYYDGQFDDARLLIHMAWTACEQGATLLNYVEVTGVTKNTGSTVDGVRARDVETGQEFHAAAKVVINATGAFSDRLRLAAEPEVVPMIAPSQGIHLVFDGAFLSGESAIMVPQTSDGRVLFAIPWHGHTLVGTTDTAIQTVPRARGNGGRNRFHSVDSRRIPRQGAHQRRCAQRFRGRSTAGASRERGRHCRALAGSRDSSGAFGPGEHHGREVDNLPAHGGGLCGPGRVVGTFARERLRNPSVAYSRLSQRCEATRGAFGLWFGCS